MSGSALRLAIGAGAFVLAAIGMVHVLGSKMRPVQEVLDRKDVPVSFGKQSAKSQAVEPTEGHSAAVGREQSFAPNAEVNDAVNRSTKRPVNANAEHPPLANAAPNASLDQTDVGRPFPISDSVDLLCGSGNCEHTERLAAFTQEPRDTQWALTAENGLRVLVERASKKLDEPFRIRNVECRLRTCVIEVDSHESSLDERLLADDWRAFRIAPFDVRWGFEKDDRGREVKVTVWIYGRWPP